MTDLEKRLAEAAAKVAVSADERDALVRFARREGMSLREIAKATNMSHEQVRRLTQ